VKTVSLSFKERGMVRMGSTRSSGDYHH